MTGLLISRVLYPLALFTTLTNCCAAPFEGTEYLDRRTNLVIRYPDGWRVEESWPVLTLVNFPAHLRPKQFIVPIHGAEIVLVPPPRSVANVSDWLEFDQLQTRPPDHVEERIISFKDYGNIEATIIYFSEPLIPGGSGIVFYFILDTTPCKVMLFYREAKKKKHFEGIALSIISSMRRAK